MRTLSDADPHAGAGGDPEGVRAHRGRARLHGARSRSTPATRRPNNDGTVAARVLDLAGAVLGQQEQRADGRPADGVRGLLVRAAAGAGRAGVPRRVPAGRRRRTRRPPNHSNRVHFDESAFAHGVALYAAFALDALRSRVKDGSRATCVCDRPRPDRRLGAAGGDASRPGGARRRPTRSRWRTPAVEPTVARRWRRAAATDALVVLAVPLPAVDDVLRRWRARAGLPAHRRREREAAGGRRGGETAAGRAVRGRAPDGGQVGVRLGRGHGDAVRRRRVGGRHRRGHPDRTRGGRRPSWRWTAARRWCRRRRASTTRRWRGSRTCRTSWPRCWPRPARTAARWRCRWRRARSATGRG